MLLSWLVWSMDCMIHSVITNVVLWNFNPKVCNGWRIPVNARFHRTSMGWSLELTLKVPPLSTIFTLIMCMMYSQLTLSIAWIDVHLVILELASSYQLSAFSHQKFNGKTSPGYCPVILQIQGPNGSLATFQLHGLACCSYIGFIYIRNIVVVPNTCVTEYQETADLVMTW